MMGFLASGCAGTIQEIITCDPPHADIYWGKTTSNLEKTENKTPHSRSISAATWEGWCYQVKKEGYHDSEIICREEEGYRYLNFQLVPLKTSITSEPNGAMVYWGASEEGLYKTTYWTPETVTVKDVPSGASWKDWYYQVKKDGYHDSEIVFLPGNLEDRSVHFELEPFKLQVSEHPTHSGQGLLAWEDRSSNELGFKVERKKGSIGSYKEIATVGANITNYTDTGLQIGEVYYYRVRAYFSHGFSAYSEEIRLRTRTD